MMTLSEVFLPSPTLYTNEMKIINLNRITDAKLMLWLSIFRIGKSALMFIPLALVAFKWNKVRGPLFQCVI